MKKNIIGVILSNFLGAGLGFLVNIFLARFLNVQEYGRINLLISLFMISYSLFEFNFSNATVIFVNKNKEKYNSNELIAHSNYLFKKYYLFSIVFIIIIIYILNFFYNLSNEEVIMLITNFYMFSIYKYVNTLHQVDGDWKKYNFFNILNNTLKFIFTGISILIIIYFLTDRYNTILWGQTAFPIIVLIVTLIFSRKYLNIKNLKSTELNKNFRSIVIPLGISNIFMLLSMRFDTLIIEYKLGSEQLGIYSAANTLALMFPLITNALRNVLVRESSVSSENFLRKIIKSQKKFAIYFIILLLISIILSPYIFQIIFGEKFKDSIVIFQILIVIYIGGIFFTPLESYFYTNAPNLIKIQKLIQMLIIIIGSLVLIDLWGILGVVLSIVLSRIYGWIHLMIVIYIYENNKCN